MGTIFIFRNVRFVIHSNDHLPAHVHAVAPKGEAKIDLETFECFFCRGFSQRDVKMICRLVREKQEQLKEAWNEFHS